MNVDLLQVDAFSSQVFKGNPAAVCPLDSWLPDEILLNIAKENNLSETAYLIDQKDHWDIRWFTPGGEIDLAGHPTLAAAWTIFNGFVGSGEPKDSIIFQTRTAGPLTVRRDGNLISMDFPSRPGEIKEDSESVAEALQLDPVVLYKSRDWMAVLPHEDDVLSYKPDFTALNTIAKGHTGVIITAPGEEVDFVSRFFAPHLGIEDPVTGSAHCTLVPYWAARLQRQKMKARQLSERGGTLFLEDKDDRVEIAGEACLYLKGSISI